MIIYPQALGLIHKIKTYMTPPRYPNEATTNAHYPNEATTNAHRRLNRTQAIITKPRDSSDSRTSRHDVTSVISHGTPRCYNKFPNFPSNYKLIGVRLCLHKPLFRLIKISSGVFTSLLLLLFPLPPLTRLPLTPPPLSNVRPFFPLTSPITLSYPPLPIPSLYPLSLVLITPPPPPTPGSPSLLPSYPPFPQGRLPIAEANYPS